MPIQIIQDDEKLTLEIAGSKIFYRRLSETKRNTLVRNNTKRGETDWTAVTDEQLEYAILGWENVQIDGNDVPFSKDLIPRIPNEVLKQLINLTGGAGDDKKTKN